jgi:endonuclease/exonuclease/phosphatase family metal-dependent hydrolase
MRLMTWNLLEGGESAEGRRRDLIAQVLREARPDVLLLVEAGGLAAEADALRDLSAVLTMRGFPLLAPSGRHLLLMVRPPVRIVVAEGMDAGGLQPALLARLQVPGLPDLQIAGVHLDFRSPLVRRQEMRRVLAALDASQPRALLGDLNNASHEDGLSRSEILALPLHHVERHVQADGLFDTSVTQDLAAAGMVDLWRLAHAGEPTQAGATVPTDIPRPPRFAAMRLDYIFLSADAPVALRSCDPWRRQPAPGASDHFPLVADLDPHAGA